MTSEVDSFYLSKEVEEGRDFDENEGKLRMSEQASEWVVGRRT